MPRPVIVFKSEMQTKPTEVSLTDRGIETTFERMAVRVKKYEGYFEAWASTTVIPPGGGEPRLMAVAIISKSDGNVELVSPDLIQFMCNPGLSAHVQD